MISLSKIVSGEATVSKKITYHNDSDFIPRKLIEFSKSLVPIVVWNITSKCNLKCVHCYASPLPIRNELLTEQCFEVVDKLAKFGVPLIIFSGGEPLMRHDLTEIANYARKKGIKCVLSTNGTLINKDVAEELSVFDYVGVSLDGIGEANDKFRGKEGAYKLALTGLLNASEVTLTGVRFTVTKFNYDQLWKVLNLAWDNDIPRFCLYHLVPAGKADFSYDIDNDLRRSIIDSLIGAAEVEGTEILTVDNPADGVFAYLKLRDREDADEILQFLSYRGGDNSGIRLACIDTLGFVHPNQFWLDYTIGNILEDDFNKIWLGNDDLLRKLREKEKFLKGKCGMCRYKSICGGFRVRAYRYGDLWGDDPSCYLNSAEIS
ncbi:heme biosynthesis protein [Archaeoglobales archaeon ex4484_92]|nr:MAG: heme biosynthesis protein [Archaeoglobales archaeon ex4484_92]